MLCAWEPSECSKWLSRTSARARRWLPQLDAVAFGVHDPAELAVRFFLNLLVDLDAGGAELGEHRVQIFDAEVDHERGLARLEVLRVGGERRPDEQGAGISLGGERRFAVLVRREPEVFAVPGLELRRVLRLEEDASDADDVRSIAASVVVRGSRCRLSERFGVRGGFVVAAVPAVDVPHRNRGESFGGEVERRHGNGVEDAAERFDVAACERPDAAGAAEGEREVGLGSARGRPAVLGEGRALEQPKALGALREREPGARLRTVRAVAAVRALVEVEVGLEADRAAMTASSVGFQDIRVLLEWLRFATGWQVTRLVVNCKQSFMPASEPRSFCPLNLSLEIFGDTWTLLVLRDMMFGGKRHFRELLQSDERISSNILADRLARLVEQGLLTKSDDPTHKQKAIYSLTEKAITLLPVIVQIGAWGSRWVPDAKKLDARSRKVLREIQEGGPRAWAERMDALRAEHLA